MLSDFAKIVNEKSPEFGLLGQINWERLPRHVAVIMDGNGRWAKSRFLPRIAGHRAGVESVRAIVDTAARLGLKALTLYAFSTENWKRPALEVNALMRMLRRYLRLEIENLDEQNIRFQAIGRTEVLTDNVKKDLNWASEKTCDNGGMVLSVALNYGGRAEIVDACREAVKNLIANGENIEDITENHISQKLYTHDLPELDLLIRTSGEMRVSNFLLWQIAYSEIYVTPTLFPDFRRRHLLEAVLDFQKRERRFGDVSANKS
ncbi:MAG: isoprenyl transferase [Pyrinomonadaceae bacterium]|nr:isoprenyl transferase [Pyrinomonadaceae bacterium]